MNKQTALITGASKGIGRQFAHVFASKGYDVVLTARSEGRLIEIKQEIENKYGAKAELIALDLAKTGAPTEIAQRLEAMGIEIDVLVNNAGFGDYCEFLKSDFSKQSEMINLNIHSLTEMAYIFGNQMKKRRNGKILNVASIAATTSGAYMSVYFASKAYVLSFSQALTEELKPYNITVTALCPGPVTTHFEETANMEGNSTMFKAIKPVAAEKVARAGYKALIKGKTIKFYSFKIKLMDFGMRFVPRFVSRKIAKKITGVPK